MKVSEYALNLLLALKEFISSWLGAFFMGVISSIIASFITTAVDKGKSIHKFERTVLQSLSHHRLRKVHNATDPHAVIRTEWAIALRDLGSRKNKDVLRALESLLQMADILESDEREVAHEALRLRLAFNNNRATDTKYLKVMQSLSQ